MIRFAVHATMAMLASVVGAWPGTVRAAGMIAPEDFAILPWDWTPGDKAVLAEIKACGFNLAGFVKPEDLDAVAAAGLKGIVATPQTHVDNAVAKLDAPEIEKRVKAVVDRVAGHPAAFGYYLRDEPGALAYSGLARWADAYRKAAPGTRPYVNLFPNYAFVEQTAQSAA